MGKFVLEFKKALARKKRQSPNWLVSTSDFMFSNKWTGNPYPYSSEGCPFPEPFFIIGSGRSGNTLLRTLLMKNYQICIPPEIPGLGNTIRSFSRARRDSWAIVVDQVLKHFKQNADQQINYAINQSEFNLDNELGLDYDFLRLQLVNIDEAQRGLNTIIGAIYDHYLCNKCSRDSVVGDKTPWNTFHLDRIDKTFSSAKYIHLVRDPRAVAASYTFNFNGIRPYSIEDGARRWIDSVAKIERYQRQCTDNLMSVKYEELVGDTDLVLRSLSEFVGAKKRITDGRELSFGDTSLPHYAKAFDSVDQDSLDKWRSLLGPRDIEKIERICGRYMKEFGYF